MAERWKKIAQHKASEVADGLDLDFESRELLDAEITPEAYILLLSGSRRWADAVKVMAAVLPAREAVWWACTCARASKSAEQNDAEMASLACAEKWVYEPNDENRWKSFEQVQEGDANSAGALAAMAAALSGGNLRIGEDQFVDVQSNPVRQLVGAAVMVSANEGAAEGMDERFRDFLMMGEDIARGGSGRYPEGPA